MAEVLSKKSSRMPISDKSDESTGQSRSHGPKPNPDRLERKRATDRETQRAIRAKNKSYIDHLERTIRTYERSAKDDLTRNLATKVSEQHSEIERLQSIMKNAQKTLEAALDVAATADVTSQTKGSTPSTSTSQSAVSSVQHENVASSVHQSKVPEPMAEAEIKIEQAAVFTHTGTEETKDQPTHVFECSPDNPLACGDGIENYLSRLSINLSRVENDCSFCPLTSAEEDEDVAIRAVFEGWHAVELRHCLDPVWKFLQATDQGLFCRSGPVERVAVLRIMRAMLLYKINPFWHPTPEIPSYMMPCDNQIASPHLSFIDFFAWPTLRAYLVAYNVTYLPDFAAAHFATHLKFRWQYGPQDLYHTHRKSGRYTLSAAFKKSLDDLDSWSLAEEFFSLSTGLAQVIPVCEHEENGEDVKERNFSIDSNAGGFDINALFHEHRMMAELTTSPARMFPIIDLDAYEPPPIS